MKERTFTAILGGVLLIFVAANAAKKEDAQHASLVARQAQAATGEDRPVLANGAAAARELLEVVGTLRMDSSNAKAFSNDTIVALWQRYAHLREVGYALQNSSEPCMADLGDAMALEPNPVPAAEEGYVLSYMDGVRSAIKKCEAAAKVE